MKIKEYNKDNVCIEDAKKIIRYYGLNNQQRKFAEEHFELQEAITRYGYADTFELNEKMIDKLVDEIADNYVLLIQFIEAFNIEHKRVDERARYKIARQLNRIQLDRIEKER